MVIPVADEVFVADSVKSHYSSVQRQELPQACCCGWQPFDQRMSRIGTCDRWGIIGNMISLHGFISRDNVTHPCQSNVSGTAEWDLAVRGVRDSPPDPVPRQKVQADSGYLRGLPQG